MAFRKSRPEPGVFEPTLEPELAPETSGPYNGPRCYVCQDEYTPKGDGSYEKTLDGGWHYSTRTVTLKHRLEVQAEGESPEVREWEEVREYPDRKLHLNQPTPEEATWFYEFAKDGDLSWHEKVGPGNVVMLQPLEGEHPEEAHDSHRDHQTWLAGVTERNG